MISILGLKACEGSDAVPPNARSHTVLLSGLLVGGVQVCNCCSHALPHPPPPPPPPSPSLLYTHLLLYWGRKCPHTHFASLLFPVNPRLIQASFLPLLWLQSLLACSFSSTDHALQDHQQVRMYGLNLGGLQ